MLVSDPQSDNYMSASLAHRDHVTDHVTDYVTFLSGESESRESGESDESESSQNCKCFGFARSCNED